MNCAGNVQTLIQILELEGFIQPETVTRSTLQRHLQKRGFGAKQIAMYQQVTPAARRFQKTYRGALYQGDIKYGPYLPIGPKGKMQHTYMAAWIDDATRFVVGAKFYANQTTDIIKDSLRLAIMQCGQPGALFVDNDKQYRSKWLKHACAKLGIRLLHAKEYSPESKGKIERFNRTVDSFLAECALQKPRTLDELNSFFTAWLNEQYHKSGHSGLNGMSPSTAWRTWDKLVKSAYAAIRQRIDIKYALPSYDLGQCQKYIAAHMKYAGCEQEIFTEDAIKAIYEYSAGSARGINKVCMHSLLCDAQRGKKLIDDHLVHLVIESELL